MSRGSVLVWTSTFFVLCLCRAQGYELPGALRVIGDWLSFGSSQSPIEFDMGRMNYDPYGYNPLETTYIPAQSHLSIEHEKTLQVSFDEPAGTLQAEGLEFYLQQFHFHSPPEHTFKDYPEFCDRDRHWRSSLLSARAAERGETNESLTGNLKWSDEFVMEMHLVHQTSDGELAVIAVMFKLGKRNKFLDKFWSDIESIGPNGTPVGIINVDDLRLSDTFIQYSGSLTTKPYTEGVYWSVMCGNWNTMSLRQLLKYKRRFPGANNRETQPLNDRDVLITFPMFDDSDIQQKGSSAVQSS